MSAVTAACHNDPVSNPTGAPDLVVGGIGLSDSLIHAGDRVYFAVLVLNGGSSNAAATTGTIRWSPDTLITSTDVVLATIAIPALRPSQATSIIEGELTIPTLPSGVSSIGVLIDTDPKVPEVTLANNALALGVTVDAPFAGAPNRLGVSGAPGFCALTETGAMYCWGLNNRRQFGTAAATASSSSPVASTVPALASLASGKGGDHLCGLLASGAATCWGRDDAGFLGNGSVGAVPVASGSPPVTVAGGIQWAEISVSQLSACGVSITGTGYCWGSNQRGEVGAASVPVGSTTTTATLTTTPRQIDGGLVFKSVAAGWLHACGITISGAAYCWGSNSSGQLGIGSADTAAHRSPVAVAGGLSFVQLTAGARQTCGITVAHAAYCWGENGTGQLGDGTTTDRSLPTPVSGGLRFSYISTGSGFADFLARAPAAEVQGGNAHTCALTQAGRAYCWGWNFFGQLGDGTTANRLTPVPLSGAPIFTRLSAGGSATCGMRGNAVWCWGANDDGQLGNGSVADSYVPVRVRAPFDGQP